jgi:uncharacterized membrane protein
MQIRSARERIVQTVWYELVGLAVITPLYLMITGHSSGESIVVLVAVSIVCLAWAGVHNTVFDMIDSYLTGRVASDRPQYLRCVHALSHEVTSILVTTPVIMLVGGFGLWEAFLTDLGLTLAYTAYAYLFHLAYDHLQPMKHITKSAQLRTSGTVVEFPKRPVYRGGIASVGRRSAA